MSGEEAKMINFEDLALLAPFLVVAAGLLALPVSILLLRRYRRSVIRFMAASGIDAGDTEIPPADSHTSAAVSGLRGRANKRLAGHVAITIGAGLFIGLTYSVLFVVWNDLGFDPVQYAFLALMFSWPAVPGVWVSTDGSRSWTLAATAVYLVAAMVIPALGSGGPFAGLGAWVWFNALPTLVVIVFFSRAFRAVGICVLGIMLAGLIGSQSLLGTLESDTVARALVDAGSAVGVNDAVLLFSGVAVAGFALAGLIGWWVLTKLGRWYSGHQFSDHMLLLGSLCFVFCIDYVAVVGASDPRALAIGLALFASLAAGSVLLYRSVVGPRQQPSRLLVLRVFDDGPDGPRLLNRISSRWRFLGPVRLIAGPDLATATIEPDEFLTFLSGRLRWLFIDTPETLARRIAELRPETDPDGRFRIEEFFCFDNTWRAAVDALVARSDVILLDLRGFTSARRGAADELELLGRRGAFDRTVVVTDERTDSELVETIVAQAGAGRPTVVAATTAELDPVMHALYGHTMAAATT